METNYIERFIDNMDEDNRKNTEISYRADLKKFYEYTYNYFPEINCEKKMLSSITNDVIEDYKKNMISIYEKSSINRKLSTLKLFFEYICVNKAYMKILEFNPMMGIKKMKRATVKTKESLNIDEIKLILEACDKKNGNERSFEFNSARNKFIISLASTTGLRISEVLSIEFNQLKINEDYIMIEFKSEKIKNRLNKSVPIVGKSKELYEKYLIERNKLKKIKYENTIILSHTGGLLDDKAVNKHLKTIIEKSGIEKKITIHSFRKSFRTITTGMGHNENLIKLIGGWALDTVSEAYTDNNSIHIDEAKIKVCNFL